MLRITIKEEPTDQLIKKQEKRKSRLRVVPVEEPPKSRLIEFKYHGEIETLPTDYQFKVKFVPQPITSDGLDAAEPKSNSGGGGGGRGAGNSNKTVAKAKSRSSKKAKAVIAKQIKSQPVINLPQPRFRVLKQATVYKKPANALGPYRRKGVNTDDDNDEIIKVVNPTRRGKKKRGRKKKEVVIIVKREEYVEYDMDEEDAIWLDSINKQRRADRLAAVDKNQFEKLIDRLEKESFKLSQHSGNSGPAIDEDAVCCICNDGECQNSNAILFCDMCNLAVHQECYGVPYIPEGQWLCRRCLQSPTRAVDCVLCPNKGGAFKHTDDNRWAHVICALWIPEVCFANTVFLEPIDSICAIPPARWKLVCCVCHKKNVGACIQCHKSNCYVAFHVTCAQQAGLYMKIEAVKEMTPQGINTTVRKLAYCINHAPASKSGSSNGLYSSGDESKEGKNDPKMKEKMKKARKLLADKLSSGIPVVNIPVIPNEVLVDMASGLTFPRRNQFLLRLHSYWKLKRQSRNGAPLLRRLQSNKSTIRFDQLLANRNEKGKRERKKIDNYVAKLVHIRYNLERSRMLLNQIIRRERSKFLVVENNRRIQIMRLQPFNQFLFAILDRVVEKDTNKFFCEPVSIEHVPDYLSYIKEPMDLGTMRQKVEQCQYRSFDAFQRDLELIISNCKTYNTPTTIWHKAAIKLELFINELLDRYRPLARNYDQETGIHLPSIHSPPSSHSTD